MDRYIAHVLTSLVLALAVAPTVACTVDFYVDPFDPLPAAPIQVYLQDTWDTSDGYPSGDDDTGGETGRIHRCVDEWNFRHRLATGTNEDLIVLMPERHHDPDGFTLDDLADGRIVIYKVDDSLTREVIQDVIAAGDYYEETYGFAVRADEDPPDPDRPGYESTGEVLIHTDRYEPLGTDTVLTREASLASTYDTACHELGHVLGVSHYKDVPGQEKGGVMREGHAIQAIRRLSDEEKLRFEGMHGMHSHWKPGHTEASSEDYAAYLARQ